MSRLHLPTLEECARYGSRRPRPLPPIAGGAGISHVQDAGTNAASGPAAVAYSANVTAGDLLVALIGTAATSTTGTGSSFSDNKSNTWTLAPIATGGSTFNFFFSTMGYSTAIYWATANAGSNATKPTITYQPGTTSSGFTLLFIFEFSTGGGSGTWTVDQAATGTGTTGAAATTAAVNTTQANEAVVALPVFNNGTAAAPPAGWTNTGTFNNTAADWQVLTTTQSSFKGAGNNSISNSWMIQMATFYLAGGGSSPVPLVAPVVSQAVNRASIY